MDYTKLSDHSIAAVIARFLKRRGVEKVFGLCGGHIMPIWMSLAHEKIKIVDVRDERAAVHMAHAHAEVTGELGVALVTAGPGVTNAVTGIANAHLSRVPILIISGMPPMPQENRGALQDLDHTSLVGSITRYSRTVRESSLVLKELDEAISCAFGQWNDPGPVFIDFPTNILRQELPVHLQLDELMKPKKHATLLPDPDSVKAAVELLWSAKRPLIISGRGARSAGPELIKLLDAVGAIYLDTNESRGLVPDEHPSVVVATRGKVLGQADVVVTVGRRLDFQLAYGSPSIFGDAEFLRIADAPSELRDNRRGIVELFASPNAALRAMLELAGNRESDVDGCWARALRDEHEKRTVKLVAMLEEAQPGSDGFMHPNKLLGILRRKLPNDATVIVDGGDFLSFARVALSGGKYLDPGPMGCLGVGIPFGIAASLAHPDRLTVVATGDGAFGFNAIEIDTAVRHKASLLIVVANNGGWQIETHDQLTNYGTVVGTSLQYSNYASMAKAFGMYAERVECAEDLPEAIDRALTHKTALLDVLITPEAESADGKSGLAIVPDLQPIAFWDNKERAWRNNSI